MKPMAIEGIGVFTARGRGMKAFEEGLQTGWVMPNSSPDGRRAYRIQPEDLTDRQVLQKARRADRFSRLAVLTAHDALRDSGLSPEEAGRSTGIIVSTAFGAHSTIFKFLDDIIDYGEANVSPTTFAHSIHNAAAAYIASVLDCKGPTMTVTQFYFTLHQALLLAYAWLIENRVDRVLVGVVDECSPAMEYICEEKLSIAPDGKMRPLGCSDKPRFIPGEGSTFFLLSLDTQRARRGRICGIEMGGDFKGWTEAEMSILGANAMAGSEKVYEGVVQASAPVAAYADIYGGLMSSGGFECAAASSLLTKGKIQSVQCVSHNCDGELAFIKLAV